MPVDLPSKLPDPSLSQRRVHADSVLTRAYWALRDRFIFGFIGPRHRRVVDIGCAEGITLERLIRRFPAKDVLGLDLSEENIAICREHGLPAKRGDAYNLPLADDSADCGLLLDVIEHLDHPQRALTEIRRVLSPRGRAVIMFPNDLTFKIARLLTGKWREAGYDYGHVRQWTPRAMRRAIEKAGLAIVGCHSIPVGLWQLSLHHIVACEQR